MADSAFQISVGSLSPSESPSVQRTSPLHNVPPQIFGSYNSDGSPVQPNLSGAFFSQDQNLFAADEATMDAKRRRIARACDMCRKKKIKCDGKMPTCSHCLNYKSECTFTQVEKKRNPPKGAKYIEGLENRLGRMEHLLKLSGLLSKEDDGHTDLGTLERRLADKSANADSPPSQDSNRSTSFAVQSSDGVPDPSSRTDSISSRQSRLESPEPPKKAEEEVEALSDMMCSLVTNSCGESRYIGSSSGFSIFSPKGIQWVNEKTGDNSFQEMISSASANDNKWIHWRPEIFSDIFTRRVFSQLPPKEEALILLQEYFTNFNNLFPLFHEPTFMHLVDRQYSGNPYEGSGWWASLNIALAIAHRLRVVSKAVVADEDTKASGYLKNALGVLTELTMRNTDLLSVQALLGMALFLQGTPNPQPGFVLVAAAIRLSNGIGLHKRGSGFNLRPEEVEQRKRVFWIAYLVDKDICLRSGRPPAQDDDDMNVELPSEDPVDGVGNVPLSDGKGKINLFRIMCEFAIIESKVYKQLYSTKAAKQSDGELLNTIGDLDNELEEWKEKIPIDFRPEHDIKVSYPPLILQIVVLHFAYYNCLTTIHRMAVHHGYWTSRLSNFALQGLNSRPLNPRVFSSAALCVSAARASIHLTKYIPQGDHACVWLVIYFPVSALVTLFANILQNPQDARARSDLRLMNVVVNFLLNLTDEDENGGVARMLGVCTEFERIAKVVLDKADKDSGSRRKRKDLSGDTRLSRPSVNSTPNGVGGTTASAASVPPPAVSRPQPLFSSPSAPVIPQSSTSAAPSSQQSMSPLLGMFSPNADLSWMPEYSSTEMANDVNGFGNPASGVNESPSFPGNASSPFNTSSFNNPFLPQDLWQMPMTLEWDWADLNGAGVAGFEYNNNNQQNGQSPH